MSNIFDMDSKDMQGRSYKDQLLEKHLQFAFMREAANKTFNDEDDEQFRVFLLSKFYPSLSRETFGDDTKRELYYLDRDLMAIKTIFEKVQYAWSYREAGIALRIYFTGDWTYTNTRISKDFEHKTGSPILIDFTTLNWERWAELFFAAFGKSILPLPRKIYSAVIVNSSYDSETVINSESEEKFKTFIRHAASEYGHSLYTKVTEFELQTSNSDELFNLAKKSSTKVSKYYTFIGCRRFEPGDTRPMYDEERYTGFY